ncbi:MAG TPA: hypothetical protein VF719_11105, partial [Abditibacteriaceae bacterium]
MFVFLLAVLLLATPVAAQQSAKVQPNSGNKPAASVPAKPPTRTGPRLADELSIVPPAVPASTPAPPTLFPFALPPFDSSKTATDVSWLNVTPAGKNGFLRARGEQFVDGRGTPVRLWGVN